MAGAWSRGTPPPPVPRELYTVPETCQALHVSHMTVYKLIETGELPVTKIGRAVRIPHAGIEAFIAAHTTNGGDKAPRQRRRPKKPAVKKVS